MNQFSQEDIDYIERLAKEANSERLAKIAQLMKHSLKPLHDSCDQQTQEEVLSWSGQLMYKYRAFSQPRFIDLGSIEAKTYDLAVADCKGRAEEILSKEFKGKDMEKLLEHYEVRVRPAPKAMI